MLSHAHDPVAPRAVRNKATNQEVIKAGNPAIGEDPIMSNEETKYYCNTCKKWFLKNELGWDEDFDEKTYEEELWRTCPDCDQFICADD